MEAIPVAMSANIAHFIYVSVAHPAPAMHAYIAVRSVCEDESRARSLNAKSFNASILRLWYVLGPGHWWLYVLLPLYKMPGTLEMAVEEPARGVRVIEVPEIRMLGGILLLARAIQNPWIV